MKKLFALLMAAMLTLSFSACGQTAATSSGTEGSAPPSAGSESGQDTEAPGDNGGLPQGDGTTLTLYSNSVSDGRGEWLTERAAQDGYKIQFVDLGAADAQARLIAEKNAPIADITFGLNAIIWESLISEDVLAPYVPAWAGEVSTGLNHAEGYYHAIVKQAILLVYDQNQWSEAEAPKDWLELWNDERFYGTYECHRSLSGGTVRNVIAGILTRYVDPDGDLGISDEGWEQMDLYYQHGVGSESGVDLYAQIANPDSTVVAGQMWSSGIEARDEEYGTQTGIVVPAVGIPYAVEGVGIVNGTKNEEEAKRFVDWFGSAQIQGEWAVEFSTLPANELAVDKANDFNQHIATLPAQDIDWALVAESIDAWCEKIELTYVR